MSACNQCDQFSHETFVRTQIKYQSRLLSVVKLPAVFSESLSLFYALTKTVSQGERIALLYKTLKASALYAERKGCRNSEVSVSRTDRFSLLSQKEKEEEGGVGPGNIARAANEEQPSSCSPPLTSLNGVLSLFTPHLCAGACAQSWWLCGHVLVHSGVFHWLDVVNDMPMMRIQWELLFLLTLGVAASEAWFWTWTGTTTPSPAPEHEGSGSQVGSGEMPTENVESVGAEIIDGPGIQKLVQTWDETTETPQLTTLTPTTQPLSEATTERATAETPALISQPGNDTSSLNVLGSGGAADVTLTGNESDTRSGFKSDLAADSRSGLGSEAIFAGVETSLGSGSEENRQIVVKSTNQSHLDNGGSILTPGNDLKSEFQQSAGFYSDENELDDVIHGNDGNSNEYSRENLLTLSEVLNTVGTTQVTKDNQQSAGELAANGETLTTRHSTSRALSTTQIPGHSHQMLTAPLQIDQKATSDQASAASRSMDDSQGSTQTNISRQTAEAGWAPTEGVADKATSEVLVGAPQCLLLDTALPFCASTAGERFVVPNHLNQSSVEEVQDLLSEWAWLLKSHCHHSLEWFFCLLLVPECGSQMPLLPCRSFCEVLRDSCWTLLDEGHLPVECHALPDEDDEGSQCVFVSNHKGNHWFT